MSRRLPERDEAIAAGRKTYFTGRPCGRGHTSERSVATNTCRQCEKERVFRPAQRSRRQITNHDRYLINKELAGPRVPRKRPILKLPTTKTRDRIERIKNTPPISETDLAWLAGYLEGEGCFWSRSVSSPFSYNMVVQVATTDPDIADRVADLIGTVKNYAERPKAPAHWKPVFVVVVGGYQAEEVMRAILPYMGIRRKAKIEECLTSWENRQTKNRRQGMPPECHPDRVHASHGMCRPCYNEWRAERRKQNKADGRPLGDMSRRFTA